MFPLVELYLAGDATQKQFCAEHALSLPVLNYWVAKYRRTKQAESEAGFVELLSDPALTERPFMEVAYPRGLRVRFFAPPGPAYLELLLGAGRLL